MENNTIKRLRNRYRLVVMNDDSFEEVITFKLSRISVYITLSVIFIFMVLFTTILLAFTPLKYYIPGYGNKRSKTELQILKIKTDSLEMALKNKEQYLDGLKKVLTGNTPTIKDTSVLKIENISDKD
ncbi:MAG: hypothetical protein ACOVMI_03200 [Chitinophagaceae bacterium]